MRVLLRRVWVVMIAAAAATVSTATAGATPEHQPLSTQHLAHLPTAGGLSPHTVARTSFGTGYSSDVSAVDGELSSVSATFTMPTFSCGSPTDNEWLRPGISVFDDDGDLSEQVSVHFDCNHGVLDTEGAICVDLFTCSAAGGLRVAPGDTIRASLSETHTSTVGTLRDITAGTTLQVTGGEAPNEFSAFVGLAGPALFGAGVTRIPTFKPITFNNVLVNGVYLSDWSPARYNLATTGTVVQAKTGVLAASGLSFDTTFVHH